FVHFDNLNFETLTAYDGEPTDAAQPVFRLRTMLTPWYQANWAAVAAWGDAPASNRALTPGGVIPAGLTTETLPLYFGVQADGSVTVDAERADAPFFRLVANGDGTYAIEEVATGR